MNFSDIYDAVKGPLASVAASLIPGGPLILGAVNALLPDGKKLPESATGSQIADAVESLPPEARASLMEKRIDLEIAKVAEPNETVRMMLESDARNPQSTRPYIAKGSFLVLAAVIITTIALWGFGVGSGNVELVKAVMDGWQFVLAVVGPLVTLLWAYFGVIKTESKNRLAAASGKEISGFVSGIVNAIRK